MALILLVGIGGFLGSISRYLLGFFLSKVFTSAIPYSTIIINLIGSLLIGIIIGAIDSKTHPRAFHFIVPGLLGGYTTFSAFSAETISLVDRQLYMPALIYITISVLGGLILCASGLLITKSMI